MNILKNQAGLWVKCTSKCTSNSETCNWNVNECKYQWQIGIKGGYGSENNENVS